MAIIQVTPELLTSKSSEVRKLKTEHEQIMQNLSQIVANLNEVWKGESQDAYVAKFESMKPTFTNFAGSIEDLAVVMDTAARELQSTDQALKGTTNSFV